MNLSFDVAGTGRPVVLIHGWCCRRRHMGGLFGELSRHHEVFNVDLPGHGGTPPLAGAATFAAYAEVLEQFLIQHGIDGAILVGHSMGGVLSVLAAGISKRVAGVVNLDGALPLTTAGREGYGLLLRQIDETGFPAAIEPFLRRAFFLPEEQGDVMERQIADMMVMPVGLAHELLVQFPMLDAPAALRMCIVPLLCIAGSHPRFDEAAVRVIRPETAFARVGPCGHFLQTFCLHQVVAAVQQFSGGLSGTAGTSR